MKKTIKNISIAYVVMIGLFSSLLTIVNLIPKNWIEENVATSASFIQKEGLYRKILNFKLFQLDNYTDVLMLNVAVSGVAEEPIKSAMLCNWSKSSNYMSLAEDTKNIAENQSKELKTESYGRYWHGYLVILKPLLIWFTYQEIRVINYVISGVLVISLFLGLYGRVEQNVLILLFLSLLAVNYPIVPLSMQFSSVFYIAFLGIIYLIRKKRWSDEKLAMAPLFFVLGGLTSFFDLLTAPLITLGLPLLIAFQIKKQNKTIERTLLLSIFWGIGYSAVWSSKWLVGSLLTNSDFLSSVFNQVELRTSGQYKGMNMTIPTIMQFIYDGLRTKGILLPVVGFVVTLIITLLYWIKKDRKTLLASFPYLMIVFMFPLWFLILRNHTIQHGWFTWRTIVVMLFGFGLFLNETLDFRKSVQFRLNRQKK